MSGRCCLRQSARLRRLRAETPPDRAGLGLVAFFRPEA